jgi:hypothetical protein
MSSDPWDPDRPLTLEDACAVIMASFPAIDARDTKHLGSGWDFDAFLTNDGWVFRFPRRAECAGVFELERQIHQLISTVLPSWIAVPHVELMGRPTLGFPYRFAGHRLIPGVDADAVGPDLNPNIAREIGTALGAIHSIPEETAREAGVAEMSVDEAAEIAWFERGLNVSAQMRGLDSVVDEALKWISELSPPFDRFVTWRGWPFAEEILRAYPHSLDRGFRDRLRFVSRLLSVMWLAEAYERHGDVTKHIAWVRNAHTP